MILERRASLVSAMGIAFVAGALAAMVYYQVPSLWKDQRSLHTVETKTIPAIKSIAGCQEKRASVLSGQSDDSLPNCPSIRSAPRVPSAK